MAVLHMTRGIHGLVDFLAPGRRRPYQQSQCQRERLAPATGSSSRAGVGSFHSHTLARSSSADPRRRSQCQRDGSHKPTVGWVKGLSYLIRQKPGRYQTFSGLNYLPRSRGSEGYGPSNLQNDARIIMLDDSRLPRRADVEAYQSIAQPRQLPPEAQIILINASAPLDGHAGCARRCSGRVVRAKELERKGEDLVYDENSRTEDSGRLLA